MEIYEILLELMTKLHDGSFHLNFVPYYLPMRPEILVCLDKTKTYPVDTRRPFKVDKTPMRRCYIAQKSYRH